MKIDLMVISGMSTHLADVYDILRQSGINVIHTENAHDAKVKLVVHSPVFILLDFDIKGINSLLNEIAFEERAPRPHIMVASVYADGNNRAVMLERGADHCVDKPINAHEVLAVIRSVLRRSRQTRIIRYKDMVINKFYRTVTMNGAPVVLSNKEYHVLCFLADHAGIILTKEEIYRAVWKAEYDPRSTNVSDQISSLRSKLGLSSKDTDYIRTVVGIGYCFGNVRQQSAHLNYL